MALRTPSDKGEPYSYLAYHLQDEEIPPVQFSRSQSPGRLMLKSLGWVLLLVVALLGPLVGLLAYICVLNGYVVNFRGIYLDTSASYTVIVSITSIISKITDLCLVPIMALMATSVAVEWYGSSSREDRSGQPTPIQLGTAIDILGGPGVFSLWDAFKVWSGKGTARRHVQTRLPSKIRASMFLLAWVLFLHYGIVVLDQVIHWTTHPQSVILQKHYASGSMVNSRPFNTSLCAEWDSQPRAPVDVGSCGLSMRGEQLRYRVGPDAARVATNSSKLYSVAYTDDGSSIMVPPSLSNISFVATSLGIKAECNTITEECVDCSSGPECTVPKGSNSTHVMFACPTLNTTAVSASTGYVDGIIDPATNSDTFFKDYTQFVAYGASTNPFRYAYVAKSWAYSGLGDNDKQIVNGTGFLLWDKVGALNIVDCQVNVRDIIYRYDPPSKFTVLRYSDADQDIARLVSLMLPLGDTLTSVAEGPISRKGSLSFEDIAALQLGRKTLEYGSSFFDTADTVEVIGTVVRGSRMQLAAFGAFAALVILLGLTAIGVGVGAANSLRHVRSPFISVVRQRLFHPQGILLDLYGHHSHIADDLLSDELHRAFAPTTEADRLAVGVFFEDGRHIVRAKRNSAEVF